MIDNNESLYPVPDQSPEHSGSDAASYNYLAQARQAYEHEDFMLALHLYLAAYQDLVEREGSQSPQAMMALHFAWELACVLRERSIAEYIYEKIEPTLSHDDMIEYSMRLQDLALDKLTELGISRDDLEEITDMISDELGDMGHLGKITPVVKSVHVRAESSAGPAEIMDRLANGEDVSDLLPEGVSVVGFGAAPKSGLQVTSLTQVNSEKASAQVPSQASEEADHEMVNMPSAQEVSAPQVSEDVMAVSAEHRAAAEQGMPVENPTSVEHAAPVSSMPAPAEHTAAPTEHTPASVRSFVVQAGKAKPQASKRAQKEDAKKAPDRVTFADIVGFDGVIEDVRALGIGLEHDPELYDLSLELRKQYGIDKLTSYGCIVFRTTSRDDASFFMGACVGEMGLPAMRVQVQSGPQGIPVLAVSVSADKPSRFNPNRPNLDVPSILILEDIDIWGPSLLTGAQALENAESAQSGMAQQASRGVREALTVIHAAISNPEVCVLASMAADSEDQGFLYELLEPMNIVDMYLPDEVERRQVWNRIAEEHPSIAALDVAALAHMSKHMCRMDIVAAARETLEDAYRVSLKERHFVNVTQEMVYSHLANYQALDSQEYKQLEDAVVESFGASLDREMHDFLSDGNEYGY